MRQTHADARLRADAPGRDGSVREELAAGIGRSVINAQVASIALGVQKRLAFVIEQGHSYRTHGQAPVWVAVNSVGSLCTPTLIRPDNEREGWRMSHKSVLLLRG